MRSGVRSPSAPLFRPWARFGRRCGRRASGADVAGALRAAALAPWLVLADSERFAHPSRRFEGLLEHQVRRKAQHPITEPLKHPVAASVRLGATVMPGAIDFDDQPR